MTVMDRFRSRAGLPVALVGAGLVVAVVIEAWGRWGELAAGVGFVGVVLLVGRRRPGWSLLVGAAANLMQLLDASGFRLWPALVSAVACLLAGRRMAAGLPALPWFAAVALAGLLISALAGDVWNWVRVVGPLLFAGVLPWLVGRYSRLRAGLAEAGWQRAEQLQRERRLVAAEAQLRERTRIAQDMHDSLGHELSLITLRAGALELDRDLDDAHRVAVGDLRAALGEAAERLREIIGVLREETEPAPLGPGTETIDALVERSRASGMDIALVGDGSAEAIPPAAGRIVYRVVQEALTNAAKHAAGAAVTVRLEHGEAGTVVTVTNQPPRRQDGTGTASGGRGLAGLRERVRLAGGSLRAGELAGGYEVVASIPAAGNATAGDAVADDRSAASDAPLAASDLLRARRAARRVARRGLVTAAAVPVAITAAVLLVLFGLRVYEVANSRLDPAVYETLRIGQPRTELADQLPPQQVDGRPDVPEPPVPGGARCEYYRLTDELLTGPIDVYRLCFADGRLAGKDFVPGSAR